MSLFSVTNQGVITVDTSEIKSDFEEAYKGALGANINLESSTFQGQMITNDTATLTKTMNEVVNIANSFSVYTATGQALDVAAAFFGYYRKQGVGTVVTATLSGTANTVIEEGALVTDGTYQYALLDTVTIGEGGTVEAEFQCLTPGAIPCPAGTLTTIVTVIEGWDGINNATAGIIGFATENDNEFRTRIMANWLNKRARSILGAIVDNIAAVSGVISVLGRENYGDEPLEIDDITLAPHSVYLCVLGGGASDIATVFAGQKTLGAGVNGNTEIEFYDASVDYIYKYRIERPAVVPIKLQIEYEANAYTAADVETQIKSIVMQWVADNPFKIHQTVSGNVLAQSLAGFNQINLLSVKVALVSGGDFTDYITTTISEVASLDESNITVSKAA